MTIRRPTMRKYAARSGVGAMIVDVILMIWEGPCQARYKGKSIDSKHTEW